MQGESLLVIIAVGVIAGWLAGQFVRGTGYGLINDLVIGVIGAFIGGWLLPQLNIHLGGALSPQSSTPRSARCCSSWSFASFAAAAAGAAVGAGAGKRDAQGRAPRPRRRQQTARPWALRGIALAEPTRDWTTAPLLARSAARRDERQSRQRGKRLRSGSLHDRRAMVFDRALADAEVGRDVLARLDRRAPAPSPRAVAASDPRDGSPPIRAIPATCLNLATVRGPARCRRSVLRGRSAFR